MHSRAVQVLFAAGTIGLWYLLARYQTVSPLFLPAPEAVGESLLDLVWTNAFWSTIRITITTISTAYAIAVIAGVISGWLLTRSRLVTQAFEPLVSGIFAIPITLFFPLFILFFGIGPASKLAYGAVYAFFPVVLNTIAGFAHVDRRLIDAAQTMGFTQLGILRHVLFPAAFPAILTGMRIGFFICFASILAGEAIASASGIGHEIALAAELFEPAKMYAWIVCVVVAALALSAGVTAIENRFRESA